MICAFRRRCMLLSTRNKKHDSVLEKNTNPILLLWYQCDQIGRFIGFGQLFKACGSNCFAQIAHILGKFSKVVKIFHFSSEIIIGQLL